MNPMEMQQPFMPTNKFCPMMMHPMKIDEIFED
jgi:hypothetical protein